MSDLTNKLIAEKEKEPYNSDFELEQYVWDKYIKKDYEEWEREQLENWLFTEITANEEALKKQQLHLCLWFSNIYQQHLSPCLRLTSIPGYKLYINSWEWTSPKKLAPLFADGVSLELRFFVDKIYDSLKIALENLDFVVEKLIYRDDLCTALDFVIYW